MNQREQIILGATVAAALYGVYEFLGPAIFGEPEGDMAQKGIDIAKIQEITSVLEKDKALHETVALAIGQISEPWRADAFFHRGFAVDIAAAQVEEKKTPDILPLAQEKFGYSGYLMMKDEAIAIINGIDYKQGEMLEDYRIESIKPEAITFLREGQVFTLSPREEVKEKAGEGK